MTDPGPPTPEAAAAAVRTLLHSVGAPLESDPELAETPQRVAKMYLDELLDGYRVDPEALLRDGVEAQEKGLVVVRGIRFMMVCPHHMLPGQGVAHLGYLPGARVVGLGTLVRLLEAYAHRLVLQESLGQQVADALVRYLGARGAGVVLRARHQCLSVRGAKQHSASVTSIATAGALREDPIEYAAFTAAALGPGRRPR